jgi:energy-coupling factor transporter ATP-binding protein EcfA2
MKANGIENIKIQNFKAFQTEKEFEIGRKHVLVYGPNGSGKSSLYWSLYTLFQSSTKELPSIQKYFDIDNDENLLNANEPALQSHIKISTTSNNVPRGIELNNTGIVGDLAFVKEINLASEFINHRLLINFYNFRNSKEINLFDVFNRDILPFVNGLTHFKDKVLSSVLKSIDDRITPMNGMQWRTIKKIQETDLTNINREIKALVDFINSQATTYLDENFKPNDIKITLTYKGAYQIEQRTINRKKKYYLTPPVYKLTIKNKKADGTWKDIDRPQSFLNEARLTKIGIAIRFCLLQRRVQNIPLKILALDDLLISLDLDNRVELIKTILRLYKEDYQIFIFTHEKGFFNEVRRQIANEISDWKLLEFKTQNNQQVRFVDAKTEIQKARNFLENGEFEHCALELRKLGEIVFRNFLVKKESDIFKSKDYVSFSKMLDEATNVISQSILNKFQSNILELQLTPEEWEHVKSVDFNSFKTSPDIANGIKKKVFKARNAVFGMIESIKSETDEALKFVKEVRAIKDRLLNYGAHPTDDTLYKTEMQAALVLFENLQTVLNKV